MIGIHWRHRIVDPTAGYQARFSWDKRLTPAEYFGAYARTQAAGPRAAQLAAILTDTTSIRNCCARTKEIKDGHVVTHEFSGDYNEGFTFWNEYEPDPAIVDSQKQVAGRFAGRGSRVLRARSKRSVSSTSRGTWNFWSPMPMRGSSRTA